ncbi:bifunctional UDP-sugar hydrolase/5'-nucleotidase [Vitiosangium sp. GDMCC 1.1324]|uniref:bifunctional metallophosphatase/5'-nucleotidase n=1 Tax=Vitiosangium sp. (strain GDMCC 1.1324) TaxID=2138576 RepID=UPI000D383B0B|nr:bifunctional UDP-sugar hydrolase/5'-nucleotidase [Vitiosangium sp. GDMCC 1.1324]PTL75376.1 bifunctional metallophosphatase/5'-nucleotidase [Vitiosangium sp. GDMCC 1.1324]
MYPSRLLFALGALVAAGCASAPRPVESSSSSSSLQAPAEPVRLTLVGTNDFHGWLMPHTTTLSGGLQVEEGGAAVFAGYVARLRADNPGGVLLLDAGDLFQGTLASNLSEGASVVDVYNHLGYAAAALGNHEFDYGPVGPRTVPGPGEDPFGALTARIRQARFPLLAVNVRDAASGQPPAWLGNDGTLLVTLKGVKVGIVGLTTPSTPRISNPALVSTLRFDDMVSPTLEAAKRLRAQGAEVVVGLAHAGGKCADLSNPRDTSSCDRSDGEIIGLVESLPAGTLDAVFAGHTHQAMGHYFANVPVLSTWGQGRSFGVLELFVDPATHKVLPERTRLQAAIPVCARVEEKSGSCDPRKLKELGGAVQLVPPTFLGGPVVPDKEVEALLAPALARVEEEQRRPLGVTVSAPLGRDYEAESALGDVLSDALREMEKADVALLNSGGLRANLKAGAVTYGDLYEVMPFDNTVAIITVTGDELRRLLTAAYGTGSGVFQQSGLKVTLGKCTGPERLRDVTLANGKPLDPKRLYRVVLPDFLARGAGGLGAVLSQVPAERIDLGLSRELVLRDAIATWWQSRGTPISAPATGRIHIVDDGAKCAPKSPAGARSERP